MRKKCLNNNLFYFYLFLHTGSQVASLHGGTGDRVLRFVQRGVLTALLVVFKLAADDTTK